MKKTVATLIAVHFLGLPSMTMTARADASAAHSAIVSTVEAQFRGCESEGWCRFGIDGPDASATTLVRVRPDGVSQMPCDAAAAVAARDRLNVLLASMIHQHKRIVLRDLRALDDGTFAATVTVNGQALAADPVLRNLRETQCATGISR